MTSERSYSAGTQLIMATIDWVEALYKHSGVVLDKVKVPQAAFDIMKAQMLEDQKGEEPLKAGEMPITGIDGDGGMWIAATEVVVDE
ncbi:unnamed protein product [Sphagnum jensenii]